MTGLTDPTGEGENNLIIVLTYARVSRIIATSTTQRETPTMNKFETNQANALIRKAVALKEHAVKTGNGTQIKQAQRVIRETMKRFK